MALRHRTGRRPVVPPTGRRPTRRHVTLEDGTTFEIDHGAVTIAAITSCTNTSNPSVMIGAALLAKKAVEKGLHRKPWVKTTLAPGSKVVSDYYDRSGLTPYLDKLGFDLVGYGCTTCIGNSGPLIPEVSAAVNAGDLAVVSVLSGNRNFEGRINPDIKMNYLASPPLVVAYALAGSMDIDITTEPLGTDTEGNPVYLRDIWPAPTEIEDVIASVDLRRTPSLRSTPTCSPATSAGRTSRRRKATPSHGTRTRPTCASRRTSTACSSSRRRSRTSPARASCSSWATRSRRTTSARRAPSRRTARPARTCWPTGLTRGTSTRSVRAAAITR